MKFTFIVASGDNTPRNTRCMAALAAQTFNTFEVLIVDSGMALPAPPDDRFRIITAKENTRSAAAKNLAAKQAQGDWLFFVDANTYLENECLAVMNSATLRHENTSVFGVTLLDDAVPAILNSVGTCYFAGGFAWPGSQGWEVETLPDEGEVWGPNGAAFMIKRDIFARLDGFDEDFNQHGDDVDFNFRLRLAGHRPVQIVEAFARYETLNAPVAFYDARNTLWAFIKNLPDVLFWPLLPVHIAIQLFLLLDVPHTKQRWAGLKAVLQSLKTVWQKRQIIKKTRTAKLHDIACSFTWNPWKFIWRRTDLRPLGKS